MSGFLMTIGCMWMGIAIGEAALVMTFVGGAIFGVGVFVTTPTMTRLRSILSRIRFGFVYATAKWTRIR